MAQAGGLKAAAAKRTVFADVSNTVRHPAAKDDAQLSGKSVQIDVLKDPAVVSAKELAKPTALLRPAQRLQSTIALKSDVSKATTVASGVPKHLVTDTSLIRKVLSKKATTVFKESHSDPIAELSTTTYDAVSAPVLSRQPLAARSKSRQNLEQGSIVVEPVGKALPKLPEEQGSEPAPVEHYIQRAQRDALSSNEQKRRVHVEKTAKAETEAKYEVQVELQEKYEYLDALEEQARVIEQERNDELAKSHVLPRLDQEEYWDEDEEEEYFDADGYTTARSRGDNTTGGVTLHLAPRITAKSQRELEAAKQYVEAHKCPDDVEDEQWDTSMVAEYAEEIFEYMHSLEVSNFRVCLLTFTHISNRSACGQMLRIWITSQRSSGPCDQYSWTGWSKSTIASPCCQKLCSSA
jgi:hypothetical protein